MVDRSISGRCTITEVGGKIPIVSCLTLCRICTVMVVVVGGQNRPRGSVVSHAKILVLWAATTGETTWGCLYVDLTYRVPEAGGGVSKPIQASEINTG